MKFLFLSGHAHLALDPSSERASGGAELQVALLSRELIKRGHNVILLAAETGQVDGITWEGVKVRTAGRFDTGKLGDTLLALPRMTAVLWEEKPDIVVVYGWTSLLYFLAKLRTFFPYRLLFICALDSEIDGGFRSVHPLRGYFFERGIHLCDARFGITEYQARLFRAQGMSCVVTRLLLQQSTSASVEIIPKPIDLLWVARCHPVKQPLLFLELAERFPQARCRMICSLQDKKLWKEVEQRAAQLANVEFIETVPYREIQHHFNEAKIFINTSLDEGVPNTFIHAGLGHTAIASLSVDPDGMFHLFSVGVCAGNKKELLIEGIEQLLSNQEHLAFAQQESARFVKEWHCNAKNVDAFLKPLSD
ncbi:MAG: hypothetical protein A3F67_09660 [Verrucomicrobia bacterium RIFCSPHIGHO2_12_FULL_41_10]|nr:MAG: hypothetical protein A3F67_09660 [Verrucomicrobia bacterium RIFCSPHIGHO2_12_FULL_41_10]HLB33704.1 glycosyltransferase family 4 protein [Chthoniobacterales bacterium]